MVEQTRSDYDAIVVAVAHQQYQNLEEEYFLSITSPRAILADIKGEYKGKIQRMDYWSL